MTTADDEARASPETLAQWAWDYVSTAIWGGAAQEQHQDEKEETQEGGAAVAAPPCDAPRARPATARELSEAFARLRAPAPVEPRPAPPSLEQQLKDEIARRRAR